MRHSFKVGLSFGLTSGIITTLGVMMGLNSGTHSSVIVIGGVLTVAIADAFSDALGIHIAEESKNQHSEREIWEATISTFLSKFIFASIFIIPLLLFSLTTAIVISVIWGLSLLSIFSYYIAKGQNKTKPWAMIAEHLGIAIVVLFATYYVGGWIGNNFS